MVLRIVMMGTGGFAVPTFESLLASEHHVVALITRPPKTSGRKKSAPPPNPMREAAEAHHVPIHMPVDTNAVAGEELIRRLDADLLVVCDYGQILSRVILSIPRLGGINLHGSLLPKYRGAAPVNWAIYNGDKETGVTVIHMTPRLDGGPCLTRDAISIGCEEDAVALEHRLAELGVAAVKRAIEILAEWDGQSSIGELQDNSKATKAPRLKKSDGQIDWSRKAKQIFDQIRAFKPWPGTFATLSSASGKEIRLIIEKACVLDEQHASEPGSVLRTDRRQLVIACGRGALSIESVKPAGKREMTIEEFMRGHPVSAADRFH